MNNSNSSRWWMTGVSAICLAAVTSLWAAEPTAAPTAATPAATPAAKPAVTAGDAQGTAGRTNDQSNNNRGNRGNRGRNGNNNNGGFRSSSGGGAGVVSPNDPYGVLQVRSIFVKGNQSLLRPEPQVSNFVAPPITPVSRVAERLLVFNGVTVVNDKPEAFVEDLRSNVVVTVKIGDSIADGTVAAIDFDDLSYQVRGQIRHVGLGDDFTGNAAYALAQPTTAPAPLVPGQIGTGASIPPVVAPTPSGMSTEDVLARLKAKRAQEAQQLNK